MCKGLDVGGNLKGGKDGWSNMRLKDRNRPDHTGPERSIPRDAWCGQKKKPKIKKNKIKKPPNNDNKKAQTNFFS